MAFTVTNNTPAIIVNQPWLKLRNVTLVFPECPPNSVTNPARVDVEFKVPRPTPYNISFAKCIFEDLTFLPGTVTLQACNHEIELLPRVLVIDRKERAWTSGAVIEVRDEKQ